MKHLTILFLITVTLTTFAKKNYSFDATSKNLTWNELESILKRNQSKDIGHVLKSLDVNYLKNFTMAYESKSLHASSYKNPRAIVFGKSGDLILTFNGDQKQHGYDSLEIVNYNKENKVLEFREIHFNPKDKKGISQSEIEFENENLYISKPNPQKCLNCHGIGNNKNARYIWAQYPRWPGVYGSRDDVLNDKEKLEFDKNISYWKEHPRYKNLFQYQTSEKYWPYSENQNTQEIYLRPNFKLTSFLVLKYSKSLANIIYKKLGPDILNIYDEGSEYEKTIAPIFIDHNKSLDYFGFNANAFSLKQSIFDDNDSKKYLTYTLGAPHSLNLYFSRNIFGGSQDAPPPNLVNSAIVDEVMYQILKLHSRECKPIGSLITNFESRQKQYIDENKEDYNPTERILFQSSGFPMHRDETMNRKNVMNALNDCK